MKTLSAPRRSKRDPGIDLLLMFHQTTTSARDLSVEANYPGDGHYVQEVALAWKREGRDAEVEVELQQDVVEYESDDEEENLRADIDLDVDIRSADDI